METNDFIVIFCATEYAITRSSYVVGAVTDEIVENAPKMSENRRATLARTIRDRLTTLAPGMDQCDASSWKRALTALEAT